MWPFSSSKEKVAEQAVAQITADPGWHKKQTEEKIGLRERLRLDTDPLTSEEKDSISTPIPATASKTTPFQTSGNSHKFPGTLDDTPSSSSLLAIRKNIETDLSALPRGPTREQQLRDQENDAFFDANGRFNPVQLQLPQDDDQFVSKHFPKRPSRTTNIFKNPSDPNSKSTAELYDANIKKKQIDKDENQKRSSLREKHLEFVEKYENKEDVRFQQELQEDEALWAQKERTYQKKYKQEMAHLDPLNPQHRLKMDQLTKEFNQKKDGRDFKRFNAQTAHNLPLHGQRDDTQLDLEHLYTPSHDHIQPNSNSNNEIDPRTNIRYVGVPSVTSTGRKVKDSPPPVISSPLHPSNRGSHRHKSVLPPNVTKNGLKFVVEPPKPLSQEAFHQLPDREKQDYQSQLLDYQKYTFRTMSPRQQELMLIAQWDKLNDEQKDESCEFQYLHLNFNTRRKVKHMTLQQKNDFLKEKHLDQQRLFLLQPLSFELTNKDEELEQFSKADEDMDMYLEGIGDRAPKKGFLSAIDSVRQRHTDKVALDEAEQQQKKGGKYDEFIDDDDATDEEFSYLDGIDDEDLEPIDENRDTDDTIQRKKRAQYEKKRRTDGRLSWDQVVKKYGTGAQGAPSDDELAIVRQKLRELTPQQQFNVLFRQHEKQLKELQRFHDVQLKKATFHVMETYPNLSHSEVPNSPTLRSLRSQQANQKTTLQQKQEQEHKQLTHVLLIQEEQRKQTLLHNQFNTDDEFNSEIDADPFLSTKFEPQFKGVHPIAAEIEAKRKELLYRKNAYSAESLENERIERRIHEFEQAIEIGRHEHYKDLDEFSNREQMLDLRMPVSSKKYIPRHPVMHSDVRHRDPSAEHIHRLLTIFLFGVNVRYKNGIVNGLLATMVPAQTLPDAVNPVNAYYIDIEHRKLDFSNLFNYYGVAAALYNPSVMPSFSHIGYEDPQLDPETNSNIANYIPPHSQATSLTDGQIGDSTASLSSPSQLEIDELSKFTIPLPDPVPVTDMDTFVLSLQKYQEDQRKLQREALLSGRSIPPKQTKSHAELRQNMENIVPGLRYMSDNVPELNKADFESMKKQRQSPRQLYEQIVYGKELESEVNELIPGYLENNPHAKAEILNKPPMSRMDIEKQQRLQKQRQIQVEKENRLQKTQQQKSFERAEILSREDVIDWDEDDMSLDELTDHEQQIRIPRDQEALDGRIFTATKNQVQEKKNNQSRWNNRPKLDQQGIQNQYNQWDSDPKTNQNLFESNTEDYSQKYKNKYEALIDARTPLDTNQAQSYWAERISKDETTGKYIDRLQPSGQRSQGNMIDPIDPRHSSTAKKQQIGWSQQNFFYPSSNGDITDPGSNLGSDDDDFHRTQPQRRGDFARRTDTVELSTNPLDLLRKHGNPFNKLKSSSQMDEPNKDQETSKSGGITGFFKGLF